MAPDRHFSECRFTAPTLLAKQQHHQQLPTPLSLPPCPYLPTTQQVLEYAARWHGQQEVVSKTVEGPIVVSTYADLAKRARLCAVALQRLGIG